MRLAFVGEFLSRQRETAATGMPTYQGSRPGLTRAGPGQGHDQGQSLPAPPGRPTDQGSGAEPDQGRSVLLEPLKSGHSPAASVRCHRKWTSWAYLVPLECKAHASQPASQHAKSMPYENATGSGLFACGWLWFAQGKMLTWLAVYDFGHPT